MCLTPQDAFRATEDQGTRHWDQPTRFHGTSSPSQVNSTHCPITCLHGNTSLPVCWNPGSFTIVSILSDEASESLNCESHKYIVNVQCFTQAQSMSHDMTCSQLSLIGWFAVAILEICDDFIWILKWKKYNIISIILVTLRYCYSFY